MNSFTDSWAIFSRLSSAQKFVLLRIFVVINASAFVLATQHDFDNDWVYVGTLVVAYAVESAFMLWLGFKRGVGFHRAALGSTATTIPLAQKNAGSAWYATVIGLSVVLTVVTGLIVTNIDDGSGLAPFRAAVFLFVQAMVMAFALFQGLRLGWNAVTVASEPVMPAGAKGSYLEMDVLLPNHASARSIEDQALTKKRASNIKRGQIALGCISVICAGLALYFHVVAYEMAKPDPEENAATQSIAHALGEDESTPQSVSGASSSDQGALPNNLPPDDPKAIWALRNAGAADPNGGAINSSTFPFATSSGAKSRDGYPIYLIECNVDSHQCVGETGQSIGSAAQVADTITPVRNADALRYRCSDWICVDPQGNVVGSVAPVMRPYVTRVKGEEVPHGA
jgi:hypothetical protein